MRILGAYLGIFIVLLFSGPVRADTTSFPSPVQAFPPINEQECTQGSKEFLSWYNGLNGVTCVSGQQIMSAAMPTCSQGQYVVFDQGQYTCKTVMVTVTNVSGFAELWGWGIMSATAACPPGQQIISSSASYFQYWYITGFIDQSGTFGPVSEPCTPNADNTACTATAGAYWPTRYQSLSANATCVGLAWQ